jgi:flagellar biosynthesis protein FlhF
MKIKRYLDNDTRSAMARVRQELGPDAVIVSNRKVGGQVELVAALDLDEVQLVAAAASSEAAPVAAPAAPGYGETLAFPGGGQGATLVELQRELESLRSMIEGRLSNMSWRESAGAPPVKSTLVARLHKLGLSRSLSGLIADMLPEQGDIEENWARALGLIAQRIGVSDADAIIDRGGIVCLVGATGVGKTTTLAKIAARFVQRHGREGLALITTDCYRIGAQEQLQTLADHLDVPAIAATDARSLKRALSRLKSKQLVLIDTAGLSQKDALMLKQFRMINSVGYDIQSHVVLPASAQLQTLQETVQVFGTQALSGAIITKVDETAAIGTVLDVVIEQGLRVSYVCDGQKIPRDMQPARAADLLSQAVKSMSSEQGGERGSDAQRSERAYARQSVTV